MISHPPRRQQVQIKLSVELFNIIIAHFYNLHFNGQILTAFFKLKWSKGCILFRYNIMM